ncbi:MAG TPA: homocysteine S-methyltransferase family protein [bacterium]
MDNFRKAIRKKVFVMDGAMGTMLQSMGLSPGESPEEFNLRRPDLIQRIHRLYVKAGADIIDTNTFGGNRIKLKDFGLESMVYDINSAGVKNAKKAAEGRAFVAASMGPTGKLLEPLGDLSFEEAKKIFMEQAKAFVDAGADIIAVETMMDIRELKAAIIGIREISDIPVLSMMTFNEDLRTSLGTPPEVAAVVADGLGADVVGANCGVGPDKIFEVIKRMSKVTVKPLISQANAGMPELLDGKTCYPATPEDMISFLVDSVAMGIRIIGGCCGTTPDHIKLISEAVKKLPLQLDNRGKPGGVWIAGRSKAIFIDRESSPVIVGERINPTGKEKFINELRSGHTLYVREQAQKQEEKGAHVLDVNISASLVDEKEMMEKAILAVNAVSSCPVMIDSPNRDVVESGLKAVDGKPIINSVTGEKQKMEEIFPLVKKYGTAVIGLTLDERGIPANVKKRLSIAELILKEAEKYGVNGENILIDPLSLTAGARDVNPMDTIEAIRALKKMGINTILGVSNVSFGMPKRSFINSAFLSMAIGAGLDVAIINPLDEFVMGLFYSSALLSGKDRGGQNYISRFGAEISNNQQKAETESKNTLDRIKNAVIKGNEDEIVFLVEKALKEGHKPVDISQSGMIPGLEEIGRQFGSGRIFLPQVMLSAEVVKKGFERLKKELEANKTQSIAKVLFATVEGDVHDIGKNIVIAMLENFGFEVIDLGKNVPSDRILKIAKEESVDVIALSALMTTTMIKMKEVVGMIKKQSLKCVVAVGGAAVTEEFADDIGADMYAKDAVEAVNKFKVLFK